MDRLRSLTLLIFHDRMDINPITTTIVQAKRQIRHTHQVTMSQVNSRRMITINPMSHRRIHTATMPNATRAGQSTRISLILGHQRLRQTLVRPIRATHNTRHQVRVTVSITQTQLVTTVTVRIDTNSATLHPQPNTMVITSQHQSHNPTPITLHLLLRHRIRTNNNLHIRQYHQFNISRLHIRRIVRRTP